MRGLKLSSTLGSGISCNGNNVAYLARSPAPLNASGLDRKNFSKVPFQERPGPAISSSYTNSLGFTIQVWSFLILLSTLITFRSHLISLKPQWEFLMDICIDFFTWVYICICSWLKSSAWLHLRIFLVSSPLTFLWILTNCMYACSLLSTFN